MFVSLDFTPEMFESKLYNMVEKPSREFVVAQGRLFCEVFIFIGVILKNIQFGSCIDKRNKDPYTLCQSFRYKFQKASSSENILKYKKSLKGF